MPNKIYAALNKLNSVLPLAFNQAQLSPVNKKLHQALLYSFANNGRALNPQEIKSITSDRQASLDTLNDAKLIVLNTENEIDGVYPFTTQKREHNVVINQHHVHAMCALDALSVAPMFACDTKIQSQCRVTKAPIKIHQYKANIITAQSYYFGIIWSAASNTISCSDSLCMEMIFLNNRDVAEHWLNEAPDSREIFNLNDAIQFGSLFFKPLLT